MNRYRTYGQLDDQPAIVGDGGFNRLDMVTDPALLPPGSLCVSENLRFDAQGTPVRLGLALQFPPGTNVGTLLHAGIFKPDLGPDRLALVTASSLVLFAPDRQTVTVVPFPAGERIGVGDHLDTLQAGIGDGTLPTLFIPRGFVNAVLKYDANLGTVVTDSAFQKGEFTLYIQDRAVTNGGTQAAYVSNFDDFETWNLLNQFQILKGSDEYLTCFVSYQKDYVLIGTQKSWWVGFFAPQIAGSGPTSAGYEGPLAGDTSFLRQITREAGPIGPRAACDANGRIYFIADQAIYAFQPQLDNELTVLGRPISANLQPLLSRMNTSAARGAWIERWGYRLYFGLPLNDEPIRVSAINIVVTTTLGVDLPFDLPVNLAEGALATVVTQTEHNLQTGDEILATGGTSAALNGTFAIAQVIDAFTFVYANDAQAGDVAGTKMTIQKLVNRNNRLLVYNLKFDDWESADTLPPGFYADWARVADAGGRKRLWVIDAVLGPALYEQNEADDIDDVVGGVSLPVDLPFDLNPANYATTAIPGHFKSRCYRWGYLMNEQAGQMTAATSPRKVTRGAVRATLDDDSAGTFTFKVRTPNNTESSQAKDFTASDFKTADVAIRQRSGKRGLEAQIEVLTRSGRPVFRSTEIETVPLGRPEE